MNLFSAAERLAAIDRSAVQYDPSRCLHSIDKFSECSACTGLCPVDAIQDGKPPAFEAELCANCLACLVECPTGAFSAGDEFQAALTSAARSEAPAVELICGQNPDLDAGHPRAELALVFNRCLAGLGSGAYLGLLSLGKEEIFVRVDACRACPIGSLESRIEIQCSQAAELAAAAGIAGKIIQVAVIEPGKNGSERTVWGVHNAPLSRRDLFKFASRQGQIAAARAYAKELPTQAARPGRNHQRAAAVLASAARAGASRATPLANSSFSSITVAESCSACGACARVCPNGALAVSGPDEVHFRLEITRAACTGCEVCAHVCDAEAITIDHAPTFAEIFGPEEAQTVLYTAELIRCERCNAPFSATPGTKLCPVCEYRRTHPFGAVVPPSLIKKGIRF